MKPDPIAFWRNPQDEAPETDLRDNLQMRVFVLGATGALGSHLMPQLVSQGYQVSGTTRSAVRARRLNETGTNGIVVDALDREALIAAVRSTAPDVLIHQLTAIPPAMPGAWRGRMPSDMEPPEPIRGPDTATSGLAHRLCVH